MLPPVFRTIWCYNFTVNRLLRIEFSDKHILLMPLTVIWKSLKNDKDEFLIFFHTVLNLLNDWKTRIVWKSIFIWRNKTFVLAVICCLLTVTSNAMTLLSGVVRLAFWTAAWLSQQNHPVKHTTALNTCRFKETHKFHVFLSFLLGVDEKPCHWCFWLSKSLTSLLSYRD